jgi:hypothetical protein
MGPSWLELAFRRGSKPGVCCLAPVEDANATIHTRAVSFAVSTPANPRDHLKRTLRYPSLYKCHWSA